MAIKSLAKAAEKWKNRASGAASDYKEGVQTTTKDQAALAIAAKDSYATGVQDAISRGAFESGLAAAGTSKWRNKSAGKGARNYPTGVAEAQSDYQAGFAPYHAALEGITYPPRGPRGSPQNIERVRVENETLHNVRVGS